MLCILHVINRFDSETIYTCFWAVNTAFIKFIYCSVLSSEPLITYQKKYWTFVQTYSWYNSKYHLKLSNNSEIYSRFHIFKKLTKIRLERIPNCSWDFSALLISLTLSRIMCTTCKYFNKKEHTKYILLKMVFFNKCYRSSVTKGYNTMPWPKLQQPANLDRAAHSYLSTIKFLIYLL